MLFSIILAVFLFVTALSESQPTNGKNNTTFSAKFGNTVLILYATPSKEKLTREFVQAINSNGLQISTRITSMSDPMHNIAFVATKDENGTSDALVGQMTTDANNRAVYKDPIGQELLNDYAKSIVQIIERTFDTKLYGLSRHVCLNVNQDALGLQNEAFTKQRYFLQNKLSKDCLLFKDSTLIDWQMASGTFSAKMIHEPSSGDRFLVPIFPGEVLSISTYQPVPCKQQQTPILSPSNTYIAPTDYLGSLSTGSWKGKSIGMDIQGIVEVPEIEKLEDNTTPLPVYLRQTCTTQGVKKYKYDNGIELQEHSETLFQTHEISAEKLSDIENVTRLRIDPQSYTPTLTLVQKLFSEVSDIKPSIFRIIKRDGGFSRIKHILPSLPKNSTIIVINRSTIPDQHKHYPLAEDYTKKGIPWIHLYQFSTNMIMRISAKKLHELSMTPIEEILFRKEGIGQKRMQTHKKITSILDILVFSSED